MSFPSKSDLASPGTLAELRGSVETELRALLARFHIPQRDAEELLERSLVEGLYKTESPFDFTRHVQVSLEARCRGYWDNRRLTPAAGLTSRLSVLDDAAASDHLGAISDNSSGRLLRFLGALRGPRTT
ncbi:MAG TPA: hypothetical protein VF017_05880 [Thermoanaerobaculia bacterium]|nr:hypothetical protein [Thermoanaerobaculia bacterium]